MQWPRLFSRKNHPTRVRGEWYIIKGMKQVDPGACAGIWVSAYEEIFAKDFAEAKKMMDRIQYLQKKELYKKIADSRGTSGDNFC